MPSPLTEMLPGFKILIRIYHWFFFLLLFPFWNVRLKKMHKVFCWGLESAIHKVVISLEYFNNYRNLLGDWWHYIFQYSGCLNFLIKHLKVCDHVCWKNNSLKQRNSISQYYVVGALQIGTIFNLSWAQCLLSSQIWYHLVVLQWTFNFELPRSVVGRVKHSTT